MNTEIGWPSAGCTWWITKVSSAILTGANGVVGAMGAKVMAPSFPRELAACNPGSDGGSAVGEAFVDPHVEPLAQLARGFAQQMARTGQQHDLAVTGEHLHDARWSRAAGSRRWSPCSKSRGVSPSSAATSHPADCVESVTTPPQCVPKTAPTWTATAPPNEWPITTNWRAPVPSGEVGGRGDVVHAARKVVRLAVADADVPMPAGGERDAEVVVEALGRAEQTAHAAAARHEHVLASRARATAT